MVALATLLLEATFPGLVETEYLLAPAGEAGKESLFFRGAEAVFSGVPFLCRANDELLLLDDGLAFAALVDDTGEELAWLSLSSLAGDTPMLCLRLFSGVLLNKNFESLSLPHEPPDDAFDLVPLGSGTFEALFGGESLLRGRVGFWFAGEVLASLFWSRREYNFVISPTDMVFLAALLADA